MVTISQFMWGYQQSFRIVAEEEDWHTWLAVLVPNIILVLLIAGLAVGIYLLARRHR